MSRPAIRGWCVALMAAGGVAFVAPDARALDSARVGADLTRAAFGPGTGVVVGIVDSGVLATHASLAGNTSQGLPRLAAQANFVTAEASNTGADVYGHGTAVLGVIASNAGQIGAATDVRYVNARVLDATNSFSAEGQVVNGIGFAVTNGANVVNLSLNYSSVGGTATSKLSLLADYLADARGIAVSVSAGNAGASPTTHTSMGPGDAYNVFSVASSQRVGNFNQVASFSSWGVEANGNVRPNITAIGDAVVTTDKGGGFASWTGTSFAAPLVAGVLASQVQYGRDHGLSTDPRVLRATVFNSAEKINDRSGGAWAPAAASTVNGVLTIDRALDDNSGAGQISGSQLIAQYTAGRQGPGSVPTKGWDLGAITGATGTQEYDLGALSVGSALAATLTWNRHVGYNDLNGNGAIDTLDVFSQSSSVSNLDLSLFRDGTLLAVSGGTTDTIEQINWTIADAGSYVLRVSRLDVAGAGAAETFGLAWSAVAVPEPASTAIVLAAGWALGVRRRRR